MSFGGLPARLRRHRRYILDEKPTLSKQSRTITCRKIDENAIIKIRHELAQIDWSCIINLDVNNAYVILMKKIKTILDKHAPEKTKIISVKNILRVPWMTPGLLKSSQKCDKLYKHCFGLEKSHPKFKAFIEYRNIYNRTKRKAKITYYQDKLNSYKK